MQATIIFAIACLSLFPKLKSDDSILSHQFYTEHFTDTDVQTWTITGTTLPSTHLFTNCGSTRIMGGYGVLGGDPTNPTKVSRQYTSLIPHYSIRLQADIYFIDSWNEEKLFLMIDGVAEQIFTLGQSNSSLDICGDPNPVFDSINSNYNDSLVSLDINVTHNQSVLDVSFETDLNSDRGWWGLKNLKLSLNLCDKSCQECSNATQCTSCPAGLTVQGSFCECTAAGMLKQKTKECVGVSCVQCVASCQLGYYLQSNTGECEPCNDACSQCSGPSNTISILECTFCAVGYHRNNPLTEICSNCLGGCSACTALSSTACTSCEQGYFFHGSSCLTECPGNTFPEETTRACYACDSTCSTCDGLTASHCTSCSGRFLLHGVCYLTSCPAPYYSYGSLCVQECPLGSYNGSSSVCYDCLSNCEECSNTTQCIQCSSSFYKHLSQTQCVSVCPTSFYASNTSLECLSCHSDCQSCFGSSSTSCTFCSDASKILYNSTCVSSCPNQTYVGAGGFTCENCHESCLTCSGGSESNCVSCRSMVFLHVNDSTCTESCANGEIVDKDNFTCLRCTSGSVGHFHECVECDSTCSTCHGTTFLDCSSCQPGSSLFKTTCVRSIRSASNSLKEFPLITSSAQNGGLSVTIQVISLIIVCMCLVLQVLFVYKTPLLILVEFCQLTSYLIYLSVPFSEHVQSILQHFYMVNFTHFLIFASEHSQNLPLKFLIMEKTGYYFIDTLSIHVFLIAIATVMVLVRQFKQINSFFEKLNEKFNPYLLSYFYRLVILQQSLALGIFLKFGQFDSTLGILSILLILIDVGLISMAPFWKVSIEESQYHSSKVQNTQNKYMALFFYNQLKPVDAQIQKSIKYQSDKQNQNYKSQASSLLSLIFYVGKAPFALCIVIFWNSARLQTISLTIYTFIFCLILGLIPQKRRVMRMLTIVICVVMVTSFLIANFIEESSDLNLGLEIIWLLLILFVLIVVVLQIAVNYKYFIGLKKWLIQQLQGLWVKITQMNQFESSSDDCHSDISKSPSKFQSNQTQQSKKSEVQAAIQKKEGAFQNDPFDLNAQMSFQEKLSSSGKASQKNTDTNGSHTALKNQNSQVKVGGRSDNEQQFKAKVRDSKQNFVSNKSSNDVQLDIDL